MRSIVVGAVTLQPTDFHFRYRAEVGGKTMAKKVRILNCICKKKTVVRINKKKYYKGTDCRCKATGLKSTKFYNNVLTLTR